MDNKDYPFNTNVPKVSKEYASTLKLFKRYAVQQTMKPVDGQPVVKHKHLQTEVSKKTEDFMY